jgi:hypothetical protein
MELILSDVVGPIPIKGYEGSRYFVTFMCQKTKLAEIYCIKSKGEVTDCFKHFKQQYERRENGWVIKRLHDDNGGEYISGKLQRHLFESGILWESTEPYTPQMNGPSERLGQTIWRKAAPLLKLAGLDAKFWPEAVRHAKYLYMRSIHSRLKRTPFEEFYQQKPRYSHIHTFGSIIHYNKPGQKKKLGDTTCRGILVGYEGDTICRILKPDGKIARGAAIAAIERILWEQFDPNDSIQETPKTLDHFSNPCKPPKTVQTAGLRQPISIPLHDPLKILKRKQNQSSVDFEIRVSPEPSPIPPLRLSRPQLVPRAIPSTTRAAAKTVPQTVVDSEPLEPATSPRAASQCEPRSSSVGCEITYREPSMDDDSLQASPEGLSNASPAPGDTIVVRCPDLRDLTPDLSSDPEFDDDSIESIDFVPSSDSDSDFDPNFPDHIVLPLLPSYVCSPNEISLVAYLAQNDLEPFEPKTLQQAMECAEWPQWKIAIEDEYNSLLENGTWTPCAADAIPSGRNPLTGKWVFKVKRGAKGEIVRYKARWVVRGFEQREGLDYTETFAGVVKPMSYKAIFALAAAYDWEIEQMDVKTAFLYGAVEEDVWITLPTGCGVDGGTAKLNKALYGLKQSPRVWYNTLANFLATLGFQPLDADASVFVKDGTIVAIYVDDLLIAGASKPNIADLKAALSANFKMSDLGACHFYLGMEIIRDRPNRELRLAQTAYIRKVLREFGMSEAKTVDTPMETSSKLGPALPDYQAPAIFRREYQSAVGSLMYAMLGTRPDIAFAVSVVSRFSANPNPSHMVSVKRIMRYLGATAHMGLVFRGHAKPLSGYTDSDWAGDPDTRRSTSGYVFTLGSGAISWSSKRQPTVSLSTCEAEYVGQTNAVKEAIWLQRFLKDIDPDPVTGATIIYGDNQGAIALAHNDVSHGRNKHMEVKHHFVREKITDGTVELQYVETSKQVADGLTKALPRDAFVRFRKAVGVE